MRLIDADALLKGRHDHDMISTHQVWNAPTIDAVEVVRCKYCKNWDHSWKSTSPDHHYCPFIDWPTSEAFYCAKAEKRTDEVKL